MSSFVIPPPDNSTIISRGRRIRSKEPTPLPSQNPRIGPNVLDGLAQVSPASQGPELPNPPRDLEQELLNAPKHVNYESWMKSRSIDPKLQKNVKRLKNSTTSPSHSKQGIKLVQYQHSEGSQKDLILRRLPPRRRGVLPKLSEREWLDAMTIFFGVFPQDPEPTSDLD